MRRYLRRVNIVVIFIVLCLLAGAVSAQDSRTSADGKHFLWRVRGHQNTVYLLGSIHVMKRGSYPLPGVVEKIYDCCESIAFETDLDGLNDPSSQKKILNLARYPEGQSLSRNLSGRTLRLLRERGLPVSKLEPFRPWFVAVQVADAGMRSLGFVPDLGIDRYFYRKAKEDGKELIFLESNDFQINLMANMSARKQESFLQETLKELDVIERMASDMVRAWRHGNAAGMYSIISIGFDEHPDIYDRFFVKRNKRWLKRLEGFLSRDDDILAVVGAGHLVGKGSLIELLRKEGYKVRQM